MVHRFATFEIDIAARELRAGGRVLDLQPRVFDLLAYLANHRARVVPKDELLDAVWAGVIVTDGSLQRAVSLARSALADAGVEDAIRTYSRSGYRLCVEDAESTHVPSPPPLSPAPSSSLVKRALDLLARRNPSQETLDAVGQLIDQAKMIDPADAEAWAVGAQADCWHIFYTYDVSETRRERARRGAMRALTLDPRSYEARLAQASVLLTVVAQSPARMEAESRLRELVEERPRDARALELLANVWLDDGHCDEAATLFMRAKAFNAAGWAFTTASRFAEAAAVADRIVVEDPSVSNLTLKAVIETWGREDLDAAAATLQRLPASALLEDHPAATAAFIHLYRGELDALLETLHALPRDWLSSGHYAGPKAWFSGRAHQLAGHPLAAEAEWRGALLCVEKRLAAQGNTLGLLRWQALLLALLEEKTKAARVFELGQQLCGRRPSWFDQYWAETALLIGRLEVMEPWLVETLRHPTKHTWFMHAVLRLDPAFAPLHHIPRWTALLHETMPPGANPLPKPISRLRKPPAP